MDLSEAFDKLVRQVVCGVSEAHGDINTITDTLLRSGVDMVVACHLAPIVQQLKVLHTSSTWLDDCTTRPGFRSSQEESSS